MVGPFMQGMLLVGIIYWYSKGLINLINDYYRVEFNRKLKNEISEQKIEQFKTQSYDLNDMDELVNIEMQKERFTSEENVFIENETKNYVDLNGSSSFSKCYRLSRKKEFLNIIFTFINNSTKNITLKNPKCWINKNDVTYIYTNNDLYSDINKDF